MSDCPNFLGYLVALKGSSKSDTSIAGERPNWRLREIDATHDRHNRYIDVM